MQSATEILSFMDLLDLDEEVIDVRAKNIMDKINLTNEHLLNFIKLLQYKQLINKRENSECDNDEEYNFVVKLLPNMNEDNIDLICKITHLVLSLQQSSIVNKSEHLVQQILSDIYIPSPEETLIDIETEKLQTTLLQLKIISSILIAVIFSNDKLLLPFLDIPLENIIFIKDEKLQIYFLTHTVPRLFDAVTGYNILDRIWNVLKENKDTVGEIALQVLCCLSNYYLPELDCSDDVEIKSDIIYHTEFWDFIIYGMLNRDVDNSLRKKSIYLAKRALDCMVNGDKSISIMSDNAFFFWDCKNKKALKKMWDNYFVLLDSLEEKQGNIVLPSLTLFETVKHIGCCWLNCAFIIGLSHDNARVRYQCLKYRLQMAISSELEAITILEAINDINLFEKASECELLKTKLKYVMMDLGSLMNILKSAPLIKWSPVPLYHLTTTLSEIHIEKLLHNLNPLVMMDLISEMLKIPCNNIIIRKAIQVNISHFVGKNCKNLPWKDYMNLFLYLQLDIPKNFHNPCTDFIRSELSISDIDEFLQILLVSHVNIDFALLYFEGHDDSDFVKSINDVVNKIQDINSRQYSNKNDCFDEAIFIVQLYKKVKQHKHGIFQKLCHTVITDLKTILEYVSSLLTSDINFDIEKVILLFEGLDYMNSHIIVVENTCLIQMYKSAMVLIESDNTDLVKKTLSMFICNTCLKAPVMFKCYEHELYILPAFILMMNNVKLNENINKENSGRIRNAFYEKSCEIVYTLIKNLRCFITNDIIKYIYKVLDCGGYGCLIWILKIMNAMFPLILKNDIITFDAIEFLNRIWTEIEELKSNSEYNTCIQQFVILITQDVLLKQSIYNDIVISYANKILDYAAVKSTPLYYLVKRINEINVSVYSHMIYVFCEILLYTFVPRKDHRITENLCIDLLQSRRYVTKNDEVIFNCNIKVLAVSTLCKISDPEILNIITDLIMEKVEDLFKNKQRYYANSLHERLLECAAQNLLFIFLKCRTINLDNILTWVMEFIGRIPHQPYVRTYFEWYIALNYYFKGDIINEKIVNDFKENNLPIQSQFMILYWVINHKIKMKRCELEEFEYVMDFFLSHIMGPTYSTRMYAQYLSAKIFESNTLSSTNPLESDKYAYTVDFINRTLEKAVTLKDKSFIKLTKDYYVEIFNIVEDLTPFAIYWGLPQLYEGFNDTMDTDFLEKNLDIINNRSVVSEPDRFFDEWLEKHKYDWNKMRIHLPPQSKKKVVMFWKKREQFKKICPMEKHERH